MDEVGAYSILLTLITRKRFLEKKHSCGFVFSEPAYIHAHLPNTKHLHYRSH